MCNNTYDTWKKCNLDKNFEATRVLAQKLQAFLWAFRYVERERGENGPKKEKENGRR